MANVGDLFINVRAKTGALQKGLRSARRSLSKFAKSGTGIIAGIGGAFGIFKTFQFLMGSLIGHSQEFREAWAKVGAAVAEIGADFAKQFGPPLAEGLSKLAEWLLTSEAIQQLFEGMGMALKFLEPIFDGLAKSFMFWQKAIEKFLRLINGTDAAMDALGQGITDPSQIQDKDSFRKEIGTQGVARGMELGADSDALQFSNRYLKEIAQRVEVPK
jgi:hypothetical protein